MLSAKSISKTYEASGRTVRVLENADFELGAGQMTALVGRSGCGKSTVLNLLGGLDRPNSGEIVFEGRHLESLDDEELSRFRNRTVGFIFQNFFLRPMQTAADNVIVPLLFDSVSLADARDRAVEALKEVGLDELAHKPVRELSGGQRQRVAIARAVVNQPRLLLADEPTGNLDTETSLDIYALLRRYNENHGTAIVIVTHDPLVENTGVPMLTIANGKLVPFDGQV
ncbi:MAG: ABC transporter ATP-binding protein [Candidatus Sumerlaeaceae bacterium]|nr:ABC transporter ATP-binding protein [Candidatus Sumerlaeaceae bacterium]